MRNPVSILYDGEGNPVAILNGNTVLPTQPGLILTSVDPSGNAKFIESNSIGSLKTSDTGIRNYSGYYYASTKLILGDTSEQILFSIENPADSGKTIFINRIIVKGIVVTTFTTPFVYLISRATSTPTGGTIQSISKSSSSNSNSVAVIRTLPTATFETGSFWSGSPGILGSSGSDSQNLQESITHSPERSEISLVEGESLVVVAEINSDDWNHWVNLKWSEG